MRREKEKNGEEKRIKEGRTKETMSLRKERQVLIEVADPDE